MKRTETLPRGVGSATAASTQTWLDLLEVTPVNRISLTQAIASRITDFEDAVIAHAAHETQADVIATRNVKDFKRSPVRAQTPDDILAALIAGRS